MSNLNEIIKTKLTELVEATILDITFCGKLLQDGLVGRSEHETLVHFCNTNSHAEGAYFLYNNVSRKFMGVQQSEKKFVQAFKDTGHVAVVNILSPTVSDLSETGLSGAEISIASHSNIGISNNARPSSMSEHIDTPLGQRVNKRFGLEAEIETLDTDFVKLRLRKIVEKCPTASHSFKEFQKEECFTSYKAAWDAAETEYCTPKSLMKLRILEQVGDLLDLFKKIPMDCNIALIAYTRDEPNLYADFNLQTRSLKWEKDIDLYPYKSVFVLLAQAIEYLQEFPRFQVNDKYLYRGVRGKFLWKVGETVAFSQFTSTSALPTIAEMFLVSGSSSLLEFHGPFKNAIWISSHSDYPGEEEALFSPLQQFVVESIHKHTHYTRYVLVEQKYSDELTTELMQIQIT